MSSLSVTRTRAKRDPFARIPVKGHKGITYRERADGSRAYSVYFNDGNGSPYKPVEGDLDAALEFQSEIRKAKRRGERIVSKKEVPTFNTLADEWIASKRHLRPWTAKLYTSALDNVLRPRFGHWLVSNIDADAVAALIRDLEREGLHAIDKTRPVRPLSSSTVQAYVLPLSGTLDLAVRRRLISANPVDLLTTDERPKARERKAPVELTEEQVQTLVESSEYLAGLPESRYDYSPLLLVAHRTGLRLGELLGLSWGDVDLKAGTISVKRQLARTGELAPPKTQQALRDVPLSADVVERLRRLRGDVVRRADEPVFQSRVGGRLSHRNAQRRGFEAARDWAGLDSSLTFHSLRHVAASRLIDAGLSPVAVASVLGHVDSTVTLKVYAHLFDRRSTHEAVRLAMGGTQ
jgi:integrase